MSINKQIKDAINPSPRLTVYFKRNPYREIWAIGKEGETLKSLKSKKLSELNLRIGTPKFSNSKNYGKKQGKIDAFLGRSLNGVLCANGKGNCYLVGLNGRWAINVTELFIEQYNKFGKCALHDEGHELKNISANKSQCKFCGAEYVKKIVIKKEIEWIKK